MEFLWIGLLVGVVIGGVGGAVVMARLRRADSAATHATAQAEAARMAQEVDRQRSDAAASRAEAADARAAVSQAQAETERARGQVSEARIETEQVRRELAVAQSEAARATTHAAAVEQRLAEVKEDRERLVAQFKELSDQTLEQQSAKAEAAAEQRLKATEQMMAPMQETLRKYNERLEQMEKERVAMAAELRSQVTQVQTSGEQLRKETHALSNALRKPQVRGSWGELQLKQAAEMSGMIEHCHFTTQHSVETADGRLRPDMRVALGEGRAIFVDSKAPINSLLEAGEASDEAVAREHLSRYGQLLKTHVDQLSGKDYGSLEAETAEFVVLFLPSEAALAAALEQRPDLHQYANQRNVMLATPAILIPLLRAVAMSWRQAELAERAAEISQLGAELCKRLGTMGGHLDKVGRSLGTAVKSYNQFVGSYESRVLVTARSFRDMQGSGQDLPEPKALQDLPRELTSAELLEDAGASVSLVGRELPEAAELRPSRKPSDEDLFSDVSEEKRLRGIS